MVKEKIKLLCGDITALAVDAIVNAANTSLLGGCGVDGAIHQKAGPELLKECQTLGGCTTGKAKITKGYQLAARYVIHTVGPVWRGGSKGELKLLAACYHATLKLAASHHITTIAFPAISGGTYGFPVSQAAMIAVKEAASFLESYEKMQEVTFVCYEEGACAAYQHALDALKHE